MCDWVKQRFYYLKVAILGDTHRHNWPARELTQNTFWLSYRNIINVDLLLYYVVSTLYDQILWVCTWCILFKTFKLRIRLCKQLCVAWIFITKCTYLTPKIPRSIIISKCTPVLFGQLPQNIYICISGLIAVSC